MPGSNKLAPREIRIATGRQLWRLNQEGLLWLSEKKAQPITGAEANTAIQRALVGKHQGESRFAEQPQEQA
jgi:hypothetical protein